MSRLATLRVRIDELVVDEVALADVGKLADAIERELVLALAASALQLSATTRRELRHRLRAEMLVALGARP